jgi:DNA polymerase-3 subunit epsilon
VLSTDLIAHYRLISTRRLTVVDLETTGHQASKGRIMELSVLQATLSEGIHHQQTHLINPQRSIPAKIVEITGISQSMVDAAPIAADVLPGYLTSLSQGVLTAHNLDFDYPFLQAEYQRLGIEFSRSKADRLCTVRLSRLMLADLPSRSLPYLVRHFQFQVGPSHRAEADTMACWLLAQRLLTEMQSEDNDTLIARLSKQWVPLKDAAKLLKCSQKQCQTLLEQTGLDYRLGGRQGNGAPMYRRGELESIYFDRLGGQQLFLL